MSPTDVAETTTRPRVEGEREQQILLATLDVLSDVGYDRLTMDAVAAAARASKATLYRRWSTKADLVIDALCAEKAHRAVPDTGTLRDDLIATFCGSEADGPDAEAEGLADERMMRILASVITAVGRDAEFAQKFRDRFVAPKAELTEAIYRRAQERGEIGADLDLDFIGPILAGTVMFRAILLGQPADRDHIVRVVDDVVLPAVRHLSGPH